MDVRFYGPVRRQMRGKLSKYWYAEAYDRRTRKQSWRSTGQTTREGALDVISQWQAEMRVPVELREKGEQPTHEVLRQWRAGLGHLAPLTLRNLDFYLRHWTERWGMQPVGSIRPPDIQEFLDVRRAGGCGPRTLIQDLRCLRWFFNWATKKGFCLQNPTADIQLPRMPDAHPRALDEQQVGRLLETLDRYPDRTCAVAILFALETGARIGAVLSLRWEWIDLEAGWVQIPPGQEGLKLRGEGLDIPLSPILLSALKRYRSATSGVAFPVVRSTLRKHWYRVLSRAGLPRFVFHSLRKTFISRQSRKGTPIEVTMAISGHRDLRTVLKVYRQVVREELLRAVGRGGPTPMSERRSS